MKWEWLRSEHNGSGTAPEKPKPEVFMVRPAVALVTVCVILAALLGVISWAVYVVSVH